jgi:hypothetical protein
MSDYQMGQRVRFSRHIVRRSAREWEQNRPDRIWSAEAYPGHYLHGGEGIIIGRRTLTEGDVVWNGGEEQSVYRKTRHFTAWLIAFDLRFKPVHVLPEHIEPIA